jgi:hypothetical protein
MTTTTTGHIDDAADPSLDRRSGALNASVIK